MKNSITTYNTKKSLASALKTILESKSFSKTSVSEIIEYCGVNRKTFYYHFEDKYALLKWMLEEEAVEVIKQFDLVLEYNEAIDFVMEYLNQNHKFINNVYHSIGRDELKKFLYADFIGITLSFINETASAINPNIPDEYKKFLSEFYAEGIAGMMLELLSNITQYNQEQTKKYISIILNSSIPSAIKAYK